MGSLLLIRHGQALNAMEGEYDGLSEHGAKQAARLGAELARMGLDLSRAVSGPRIRQRRTAEEALKAAGVSAQAEVLPELDEHMGHDVVLHVIANPPAAGSTLGELLASVRGEDRRSLARGVAAILRNWAAGDLQAPVGEDFATFLARARRGIEVLKSRANSEAPVIAFTSAGFIGAAVAQALGAGVEHAIELALAVDNASFTELRFSRRDPDRLTLRRFNVVSHLQPELLTYL